MAVMRAVTTSLHSLRVTGTASNELVLGGKLGMRHTELLC